LKERWEQSFHFFGVFDGHGGDEAADFASNRVYTLLVENMVSENDIEKVISKSFATVEEEFLAFAREKTLASGTTAAVALWKEPYLYTANIGDSEIVLSRKGKAIELSECHNPKKNEKEGERVTKEGGVIWQHRVGHPVFNPVFLSLGVSRAIGDMMFKKSKEMTQDKPSGLTAIPYVRKVEITKEEADFLIIACDGVWDVFEHQEAVNFVQKSLLENNRDPQIVAKLLAQAALDKGSRDNITALVLLFHK